MQLLSLRVVLSKRNFSERVECSFSCDANFRYNRDIIMVIEQFFSNFNFDKTLSSILIGMIINPYSLLG